jgi:hypothetical protein
MQEALDQAMLDGALDEKGIFIFVGGIDFQQEVIWMEIAADDADRATAVLEEHCGFPVRIEVTASAAWVEQDIPWDSWIGKPDQTRIDVWTWASDTKEPVVTVDESAEAVIVTLRELHWQGAHAGGHPMKVTVELEQPLGPRSVVDGATGERRRFGRPR